MLSWVDAASYTERARPGYEALIDLKALSWRYMNLCHRNKYYDMHSVQRVGCTIDSFPFYYLWMHAACTRGHGSK